mgnify:CR=1 FL=1
MSNQNSRPRDNGDRQRNRYPCLFTTHQWRQLVANDDHSTLDEPPVVKLFTPDAAATWLLYSVSRANPDLAFGLCDLGLACPELGYVSLHDIARLRGRLGLPVERDRSCALDKPLRHYADHADRLRRIEV